MAPEIGALILDGYVYFVADDGSTGREIWRSDGTAAGTTQVADLITGQDMGSIAMFAVLNGRIVFLLGINGPSRLWASDGTAAGTNILHNDAEPIGRDGAIFQGGLYFAGRDNSGRTELWRTDGTPAGTEKAIDLSAQGSTAVALLAATQSTLLFNNCVPGAGCVMYGTDGTVAGTRVADLEMRNQSYDGHVRISLPSSGTP
jgi:ELWxxDGT repeat protein